MFWSTIDGEMSCSTKLLFFASVTGPKTSQVSTCGRLVRSTRNCNLPAATALYTYRLRCALEDEDGIGRFNREFAKLEGGATIYFYGIQAFTLAIVVYKLTLDLQVAQLRLVGWVCSLTRAGRPGLH